MAALALFGWLAGCRSTAPAPGAEDAKPAMVEPGLVPASAPDPASVVERVPLQHVTASVAAEVLRQEFGPWRRVQSNENAYCVLLLPEALNREAEPRWDVAVDSSQNALILQGTPEKVAQLRGYLLALDAKIAASR